MNYEKYDGTIKAFLKALYDQNLETATALQIEDQFFSSGGISVDDRKEAIEIVRNVTKKITDSLNYVINRRHIKEPKKLLEFFRQNIIVDEKQQPSPINTYLMYWLEMIADSQPPTGVEPAEVPQVVSKKESGVKVIRAKDKTPGLAPATIEEPIKTEEAEVREKEEISQSLTSEEGTPEPVTPQILKNIKAETPNPIPGKKLGTSKRGHGYHNIAINLRDEKFIEWFDRNAEIYKTAAALVTEALRRMYEGASIEKKLFDLEKRYEEIESESKTKIAEAKAEVIREYEARMAAREKEIELVMKERVATATTEDTQNKFAGAIQFLLVSMAQNSRQWHNADGQLIISAVLPDLYAKDNPGEQFEGLYDTFHRAVIGASEELKNNTGNS